MYLLILWGHFYKDIFTCAITWHIIYHVLDASFWFTLHNTKLSGEKVIYQDTVESVKTILRIGENIWNPYILRDCTYSI